MEIQVFEAKWYSQFPWWNTFRICIPEPPYELFTLLPLCDFSQKWHWHILDVDKHQGTESILTLIESCSKPPRSWLLIFITIMDLSSSFIIIMIILTRRAIMIIRGTSYSTWSSWSPWRLWWPLEQKLAPNNHKVGRCAIVRATTNTQPTNWAPIELDRPVVAAKWPKVHILDKNGKKILFREEQIFWYPHIKDHRGT